MGIALAVIGILGLVAAVVLGVVAFIRRVRSRPARRTGLGAGGLAAGGLVLFIVGVAVLSSGSTTANTDQAADTTTTSPNPAASSTPPVPSISATATTPPPATTAAAPTPPPVAPTSPRAVAQPAPPTTTAATAPPARAASGPAAAAAAALAVKGRAPKTGYSREAFGPAWADIDGNGCDTRDDVLRRDLTASRVVAGTGSCKIATGTLTDPYSGTTIAFTRGQSTSTAVQIDHVVALSDAWQTGAFAWPAGKREQFANDPLNLLAVQGTLNEAKGDGDAATWLPPNKAERCAYIARQVAVKTTYSLWVTPAEAAADRRVLTGCPDQALPDWSTTQPPALDPSSSATAATPTTPAAQTTTPATPRPRVTTSPRPRPTPTAVPPGAGATALCMDGTPSYARHHQGACSHHGGVKTFYK